MTSAQTASLHYASSDLRQEAVKQHTDQYRHSISSLQAHQVENLAIFWSTCLQGHASAEKGPSKKLPTNDFWGEEVYRQRREENGPAAWEKALAADLDRLLKLDPSQVEALEDLETIQEVGRQTCELAIISHCISALRRQTLDAMPYPEINWVHQACWELLNSRQQENLLDFVKANRASVYRILLNDQLSTTPICMPLPPEALEDPSGSDSAARHLPDAVLCFADGQILRRKVIMGQHPHDRARWITDQSIP